MVHDNIQSRRLPAGRNSTRIRIQGDDSTGEPDAGAAAARVAIVQHFLRSCRKVVEFRCNTHRPLTDSPRFSQSREVSRNALRTMSGLQLDGYLRQEVNVLNGQKTTRCRRCQGALAVPMAAQAVDFSVSGHVGRAIVIIGQRRGHQRRQLGCQRSPGRASGSRAAMTLTPASTAGSPTWSMGLDRQRGKKGSYPFVRHANVSLSGDFGALTLGQQSDPRPTVSRTSKFRRSRMAGWR